ncbi:hypothetical protein [Candidatus Odyssella thessalonicensis]|uniref:hypothetical protein n=1 Tax=Candidatus Odyssella thessalonicensis TaxID=84647 RepID=UPI000225A8D5|nr:hypothetical protein [Candidatus Odyssella thessalonicensis]
MNKTTLLSGLLLTVAFGSLASFASDHNDNRRFQTGKVGSLISRFESMAQPSAQPVKPSKFTQPTRIAAEPKKVF